MSKINTASNTLNTKGISSCIFLTKNVNVGQHSLVCFLKPLWVSADGFLKGGLLSNMHKGKITLTNWCSFYRGFGFTFQRTSVWILVFLCIINQIKESQVLKGTTQKCFLPPMMRQSTTPHFALKNPNIKFYPEEVNTYWI